MNEVLSPREAGNGHEDKKSAASQQRAEKRAADKESKKLQLEFLQTCPLSSVQMNQDGMDIEKIGSVE